MASVFKKKAGGPTRSRISIIRENDAKKAPGQRISRPLPVSPRSSKSTWLFGETVSSMLRLIHTQGRDENLSPSIFPNIWPIVSTWDKRVVTER